MRTSALLRLRLLKSNHLMWALLLSVLCIPNLRGEPKDKPARLFFIRSKPSCWQTPGVLQSFRVQRVSSSLTACIAIAPSHVLETSPHMA
jgi:hypothetical protein